MDYISQLTMGADPIKHMAALAIFTSRMKIWVHLCWRPAFKFSGLAIDCFISLIGKADLFGSLCQSSPH